MSMCRVVSCVVGRGCFPMTSAFSWQNSVSLCPASFCTPRPNLSVTPGISWLPTFAFQSPTMKKTYFLGVSSRRSCRSSRTSHEIQWCLLLGRKAMTNLDIILKSRDRGCPVKAVVFPVVTYGCESWTLKTAEHRRIDAFELWCWRRLLRVPWTEGDPTSPF